MRHTSTCRCLRAHAASPLLTHALIEEPPARAADPAALDQILAAPPARVSLLALLLCPAHAHQTADRQTARHQSALHRTAAARSCPDRATPHRALHAPGSNMQYTYHD